MQPDKGLPLLMSNIDEGKEIGRETSLEKNFSAVVLGFKLININLYPHTYSSWLRTHVDIWHLATSAFFV